MPRTLHHRNQEHTERLHELLHYLDRQTDTASFRLAEKLRSCETRFYRGIPKWCNQVACPRCRDRFNGSLLASLRHEFADADHRKMVMVCITAGLTDSGHVEQIGDILHQKGDALRQYIYRLKKKHPAWRKVRGHLSVEIDAFDVANMRDLGSDLRSLYRCLKQFEPDTSGCAYVVTWHGFFDLGSGVSLENFTRALRRKFPHERQIHVQAFDMDESFDTNLSRIAMYANKHECEQKPNWTKQYWPIQWIADLYTYYCGWSRRYQRLKWQIGFRNRDNVEFDLVA
jgi:hypothetical protein